MRPTPAFTGQPLDRADPLRADPQALAALRSAGLLLDLHGLVPEIADEHLHWLPLSHAAPDAELVFLGLRGGQGLFAVVPDHGNADPAYLQRPIWPSTLRDASDASHPSTVRAMSSATSGRY